MPVRVVSVGYSGATVALDSLAEVRVFADQTLVLETSGLRRLTVVDGEVRDELVSDARTRERLTRLFNADD